MGGTLQFIFLEIAKKPKSTLTYLFIVFISALEPVDKPEQLDFQQKLNKNLRNLASTISAVNL